MQFLRFSVRSVTSCPVPPNTNAFSKQSEPKAKYHILRLESANILLKSPYRIRQIEYTERGDFVYYVKFGAILKTMRKEKGLSQSQLGAMVGTSKAVVSKYENSQSYPGYDVLIKLANTFKVSTDYLLGVERKKTIDIDGLTNKQIDSLITVAGEYRKLNENIGKMMIDADS